MMNFREEQKVEEEEEESGAGGVSAVLVPTCQATGLCGLTSTIKVLLVVLQLYCCSTKYQPSCLVAQVWKAQSMMGENLL